ncbi:hypothetical protein ACFPA8_21845 [Streptomyces ovatisporus]|uniref:Hydrolytic protein n=1 Tax=Streptomyces ovatisporus TaxID=1128682 RepID=A0ABV9ACM3_9ACTN
MSVSASLDESTVSLEPGSEAALPVQVLNSGTTVEEVRFEVVGPCAGWATVEPESLSLYPGASGAATITLRPPRSSSVMPGETPLGLRVVPTSDATQTVVPERAVEILPFSDVTSEIVPRSSHSAWRGRHEVAVDNRGNTHASFDLEAREETERARLVFEPAELNVPPGEAKFAKLRVRPVHRVWRGAPVTHPFQVLVTQKSLGEGAEPPVPVVLDGTYEQEAILPRWLPRVLVVAVLLVGLLAGLWYGLLKPTVRSAAKEAITPKAIQDAQAKHTSGGAGGGQASGGADAGASGSGGRSAGQDGGGGSGSGSGSGGGGGGGGGASESARTQVKDSVGGGASDKTAYTVPGGKTFALTDIVVQNPQGDSGTVVVSSEDGQVLDLALENFRDSDYHFVTPIEVSAGGKITISITCREVGKPVKAPKPSQCSESLFLGGSLRDAKGD